MLFHGDFRSAARRSPDTVALIEGATQVTYGELVASARRLAAALQAEGVRKGDRVAVMLPNGIALVTAILACSEAGAAFVPLNPQLKTPKLHFILEQSGAAGLITHHRFAASWRAAITGSGAPAGLRCVIVAGPAPAEAPAQPGEIAFADALACAAPLSTPDLIDLDLASIIYTSGTTGEPKGVMLSHRNMVSAAASVQEYLQLVAHDVIACVLPMCFSYGLYQPFLAAKVSARVLLEAGFTFPVPVLEAMQTHKATVFPGVPAVYATLLALSTLDRFDLGSVRIMTNAAAALPEPHLHEIRRRFPHARFFSMYGQTECKRITYLPPEDLDQRAGSVGRGMPNQELYLIDETGRRLPPGSTGELVVRGSHVMLGYWQRPDETADKLRPGVYPGERVLHTGDVFRTDADGYLYFVARKDDIIKTRGEKVSPREVENALHAIPGVETAAVIGMPDPMLGEAVKAYVVLRAGVTLSEKDIVKHCLATLEAYMVPKSVEFLPELPLTASGKVNKAELKNRVSAR